jgi:hypothetical protein
MSNQGNGSEIEGICAVTPDLAVDSRFRLAPADPTLLSKYSSSTKLSYAWKCDHRERMELTRIDQTLCVNMMTAPLGDLDMCEEESVVVAKMLTM